MKTANFDFRLPEELIALEPPVEREDARLLHRFWHQRGPGHDILLLKVGAPREEREKYSSPGASSGGLSLNDWGEGPSNRANPLDLQAVTTW